MMIQQIPGWCIFLQRACILDERRFAVSSATNRYYVMIPTFFCRWTSNSSAHSLLACSKFTGWRVCRSWCTSSCMPLSKHGWVQVRKIKISFLMFCLNKVVNEAWLFLFPVCFHLLKKERNRKRVLLTFSSLY